MNYYPFHVGDYASATRHLSWDEDCAYRRLLDAYYTAEKPLPAEERAVCRLVLATTEAQREAAMTVLREFWELTDAGWINRRADAEIEAMREKQQKQRDKANKRWHKPEPEPGNAPAMPQHAQSDATARKSDADAMPPTPTPTPTPNKEDSPAAPAPAKASRKCRLPDGFAPSDAGVRAARHAGLDVAGELAQFRDWHTAQGSVMADWQAAWRTWVSKAVQFGRGGKRPKVDAGDWFRAAGFDNPYEANNAQCFAHNAGEFRNGKRLEAA